MSVDVIRVVIADDHAVVRTGLKAVLKSAPDIEVIGEAKDGVEAVALVERLRPDVLISDLSMGNTDGAQVTREIVSRELPTRVLILTMHTEEEYLVPLMQAGAGGFLMKNAADKELTDAVRALAHGDVYVRPSAARILAKGLVTKAHDAESTERAQYEQLTAREKDVLLFIAQGFSAPEIGEKLGISAKTVDTYKQRIHDKVGLSHRSQYIQFALKLHLLV